MIRRFATLLCAVTLALPASGLAKGKALPDDFKLSALEGKGTVKPADLKGKKVVLQFFASWCEGCSEVMTQLNPMVEGMDGVKFMPVSVDESMAEAREYFAKKPKVKALKKLAYLDNDTKLASALDVKALPAIVIVDGDGKIVHQMSGHPTKKQYDKIKSLLSK